ncbi:uncharacterized protein LOC143204515 isoform X3 [Rhynchophorus ferrugineus]|uniref:uncharacterized protein LOC143204515 isoform X3 n=1 Tax=Rhynchophorus ferrugineus TaxID=354439 RepID=UPI003FCC9196
MKHDGHSNVAASKKKKNPPRSMKPNVGASKKDTRSKGVVKPMTPICRKRKEKKGLSADLARDTIAETIAFVIQGQLTPIKPTPLPVAKPIPKDHVLKRASKHRCCKLQADANRSKNSPKVQTKTAKNRDNVDKLLKKPSQAETRKSVKLKETRQTKLTTRSKRKTPPPKLLVAKKTVKKGTEATKTEKPEAVSKKIKETSKVNKKKPPIRLKTNEMVKPRKKCANTKLNTPPKSPSSPPLVQIKQETPVVDPEPIKTVKVKEELQEEEILPISDITTVEKETSDSESGNNAHKTKAKVTVKPKSKVKKAILLKSKTILKKKLNSDEKRKAKLIQFWNSPKRHREASLNALAKVHCLYENESKVLFEKIAENSIIKREPTAKEPPKSDEAPKKPKPKALRKESYELVFSEGEDTSEEEPPVQRTLRDVPGLRAVGKHWDMHDSISSDNFSDTEHRIYTKKKVRVKKEAPSKKIEVEPPVEKAKEAVKPKKRRRRQKAEVFMDLKDMVVKKRMASLNASAILAASYSNEKKPTRPSHYGDESSSREDSDSSGEEYFAATEEDLDRDLARNIKEEVKKEEDRKLIEVHTTPNKKVAVILNQDTDLTITGVYVNSTTRSTHHEGYCSIAGMQYRISATSHTQTAATAVATETLLQSSSSENTTSDGQPSCSKSYTPLDALSSMQPPPGPGLHSGPSSHHISCGMGSPQHRQPPPSGSFSSPHHVAQGFPASQGAPPGEPTAFVHGYYQPAGPLITVPHGHGQPQGTQPPPLKSVPLSDTSPSSVTSSVHQVPPPPAPSSNNGDSSDNEVIITSVTAGTKDPPPSSSHPPPPAPYRYAQYQYPPYPYSSQFHYPTPPPPSHPYAHHELCYPSAPAGSYVRHAKYAAPPSTFHRYSYYGPHGTDLYPPPGPPTAQPSQQVVVSASPVSSTGSYPPTPGGPPPPPPTIMETYPPPTPPTLVESYQPPPHYYPATYGLPPACYSHSPTRAIPYINGTYQTCPCPLNSCPKNGHAGPLTGEGKRSNITKDAMPLPPVALALPLEPASATGPPSPARGSAGMPSGGMPPPPSPAGANYHTPAVAATVNEPKQESHSPEAAECKVEKTRRARVGKAMVRRQNTMLLMCNPQQQQQQLQQDYVKREIESPKNKEEPQKKTEPVSEVGEVLPVPEACQTTTCTSEECERDTIRTDIKVDPVESQPQQIASMECESEEVLPEEPAEKPDETSATSPPDASDQTDEPLPPCIATVAENVKVKNMKRKQSMTKDQVPEAIPQKKKKNSSYKDFIKKHTNCFKISNGKKKLVSKESTKAKLPKIKLKTSNKKKLNASKEQTNNRRIKDVKTPLTENNNPTQKNDRAKKKGLKASPVKSAAKVLDNLIAKNNIDKVIEEVISESIRTENGVARKAVAKPVKTECKKVGAVRRKTATKSKAETTVPETIKTTRKSVHSPKWSNGWMWEGKPYEGKVFINSDETTVVRKCYPAMMHEDEGDMIVPGDCVLLKAGPRRNDLPYVAKIAALWENPEDGEMMMSLLWYYRPEHTEQGRLPTDQPDEVFASRHKDSNSVACIDDKCYVLTFNEYCRYKKHFKRLEEGLEDEPRCIPLPEPYPRVSKQPPASNISPEMVFFCRKVYDFRQKRIIKNPT